MNVWFLEQANKEIEAPTNIKIINITGQKTVLLKWVDKHQRYQVYVNMIVTNSAEYNVLFENEWLKMDNANIDYGQNKIIIKYEGIQQ